MVSLGLGAWRLPMTRSLEYLSYDLPFLFVVPAPPPGLIIVELDEQAHRDLKQTYGQPWDRSLHARLLNKLRRDGCELVVFDIWFADPGPEKGDAELEEALRQSRKVVLAAHLDKVTRAGVTGEELFPPLERFRKVAVNWGIDRVPYDDDSAIRRLYPGTELDPSLAWKAASILGASATKDDSSGKQVRWLRYYGPYGTIPHISFSLALEKPDGFFRGKTIFVGGRPRTRFVAEEIDEFPTPYTRWDGNYSSGVEVQAAMFANLVKGDWLRRVSPAGEFGLLTLCGLVFGAGFAMRRPLPAFFLCVVGILGIAVFGILLAMRSGHWFAWMLVACVQLPAGFLWSIFCHMRRTEEENERMLASVKRAPAAADAIPASRTERIRNFFGHRAPVTPAPVLAEDKTVISPSGGGKRRGPSIAAASDR